MANVRYKPNPVPATTDAEREHSQPPVYSNQDDVRRCQLQAMEVAPSGVLPGSQLDIPIRRAEFEKACLQEAAEQRARGEVPR